MVGGLMILFSGTVLATDVSIRLTQPKTPTNLKNLELSFVAMDLANRPVTVTCYGKDADDGTFSQLGYPVTLTNGGTSDRCPTTESVIQSNGVYHFKAVATNGIETVESGINTVEYQTDSAGTPINYSKESLGGCQYKIKFKTADDGKTAKAEIYRSEMNTFTADSRSRIVSIDAGPNQDKEHIDSIPTCGKTYYYAVRAFTASGNGSALVGDPMTSVTTVTTSTATGTTTIPVMALPVAQVNRNQLSQVNLPPGQAGTVLGEQTEPATTSATDLAPSPTPLTDEGGLVLTTQTTMQKWWLFIVALGVRLKEFLGL
jgi:hypothetical protein